MFKRPEIGHILVWQWAAFTGFLLQQLGIRAPGILIVLGWGIIAEAEQKKTELLDLKELTPEEKVDLETLDSIIDSADSMEVFNQYQKYAAKKIYKDAMTEYSEDDMDINEIASNAEDRIHLRNDIRHDIKQTENAFLHFAASFPKVNMIFYPTRADVPPEVRSELENMNRPIELAKAFVYDGKVCMIGENVRPSQVIRVGTHEVIGHLGLRTVFGDKFDSFLDIVAQQHSSEIEENAKLYNQDIGTVEGIRYATEEFLAKTAETKAELKPHWWSGFLSWIKQQLRQLPMFKNLRVTDREIESAFMRSFKVMSKGRTISELSTRFAFDEEGKYFPAPNEWGTAYTLFSGKQFEAIQYLLEKKEGFVPAAFQRTERTWEAGMRTCALLLM